MGAGIGECLDGNTIGSEVWLRSFSLIEVLLSALLLPAFSTLDQWLRKPRLFYRFATALAVGPGVSGVMAAVFFHQTQHQTYLRAFDEWAAADALGIAAMIPLALSVTSFEMRKLFHNRALPRTLGILCLAAAIITLSLKVSLYPLLFLIYPTLLLVDLTLSFSGSAIAVAGMCFFSIYLTSHHEGRFGPWPAHLPISRDVGLQIFLGFHVLALFPASILIRERQRLVEDLNSSNAQLLMLASLDGLTGLANRRSLDEHFSQEWKRAIRLATPLALIMVDVDLFKQFNDLYGHTAGDECLRVVANLLKGKSGRAQDHVARFGGEEFALLLPHTSLAGAQHLAEEIGQAIFALKIPHGGSPWGFVTVSSGCAELIPTREMNERELLKLADAALYRAKRGGRNCVKTSMTLAGTTLVGPELARD